MTKLALPKSPVVFSENPHGYRLGTKRLSGITGLIHAVLGLGVYPGANDYVLQVAIPRAGAYGSAVHHAIELYDEIGIKQVDQPSVEVETRDYGTQLFGPFHVARELETYIRHREGFEPVANEYTVSDNFQYASNIDNVWRKIATGGIWLIDTKTNNLDYYPGGKAALKLYLSWQLSIYAYLFEKITGLKVEGLACNWLRHENGEFWEIERQPDDFVRALLEKTTATWVDGHWVYEWTGDPDMLAIMKGSNLPATVPEQQIVGPDIIETIRTLLVRQQEINAVMDDFKAKLKSAMKENGIKSFKCEAFSATIAKDSLVTSFNSKKFKEDHPDLFLEYSSTSVRAGSFTLKLNEKK